MLNIPFLSAVSELISGTVNDEFKRLIRPQPLVAAGVFLTLNLVLIFPELLLRRVAFAVALAGLSTVWQGLLGTLVLLILAYLIDSLGSVFVNLVSGSALRESQMIGSFLRSRQRHIYDQLRGREAAGWAAAGPKAKKLALSLEVVPRFLASRTADPPKDNKAREQRIRDGSRAAYRLAFEFPDDRNEIAPTRLGNVLVNASTYTYNQYGVHLATVWPVMEQSLDDTAHVPLKTRVRESQEALTFLASIAVLLVIVALEALLLVRSARTHPLQLVVAIGLLPLAYAVYSAAVQKALAWNRDIRLIFDLYLDAAAQRLGFRALPVDAFDHRKARWESMSTWLAYGAAYNQRRDETWYVAAPTPTQPVIQKPRTVEVASWSRPQWQTWQLTPQQAIWGRGIEYLLTVTHAPDGEHVQPETGVYLLVTDDRLIDVPPTVMGRLVTGGLDTEGFPIVGRRQPSAASTLLWSLDQVAPGASRVLMYAAPDRRLQLMVTVAPNTLRLIKLSFQSQAYHMIMVEAENPSTTSLQGCTLTLQFGSSFVVPASVHYRLDNTELQSVPLQSNNAGSSVSLPADVVIKPLATLTILFDYRIREPDLEALAAVEWQAM